MARPLKVAVLGATGAVGTTLVLIVGVMMVLREIGWDITPLIAGYFILLDDQFYVGGVIQAASVSGQVEPMTRRTTIVRDLQRTVHFVPNGEIKVINNLT